MRPEQNRAVENLTTALENNNLPAAQEAGQTLGYTGPEVEQMAQMTDWCRTQAERGCQNVGRPPNRQIKEVYHPGGTLPLPPNPAPGL